MGSEATIPGNPFPVGSLGTTLYIDTTTSAYKAFKVQLGIAFRAVRLLPAARSLAECVVVRLRPFGLP